MVLSAVLLKSVAALAAALLSWFVRPAAVLVRKLLKLFGELAV